MSTEREDRPTPTRAASEGQVAEVNPEDDRDRWLALEAALGLLVAAGGRAEVVPGAMPATVRVLVQGGRAQGYREEYEIGAPLAALERALFRYHRRAGPSWSLVCDRGCVGVVRVGRRDVDVTTSGHTDVRCAQCSGPMIALP